MKKYNILTKEFLHQEYIIKEKLNNLYIIKKSRKQFPELCFKKSNVKTICRKCHPKIEFKGKRNDERQNL